MRPFILAETNWKTLKEQDIELAVLPWGATEAHNLHLPFSTDNIMVERIAADSAALAWERGARPIILPAIPFGVNTGQMDIRLNINMNPSTQLAILDDIADVLERHSISRFLILNGHGGNDFRQMIRELGLKHPGLFISTCNWYKSFENSEFFIHSGGHADEMETSVMQFIAPELVLPLNEAGEGKGKKFRIGAFNEGWAWAERKWTSVTSDTGIGNPYEATPLKGQKCFDAVVEKIAGLMYDLAKSDPADLYE
jgi:creatinine amidohydrolase